MTVIELGEITAGDEPARPAPKRPFDRRVFRRLAAVLVGLLCLATVHSSAVPVARGLARSWAVPFQGGDSFALAGGVFVLHNEAPQELTAYPLAGGVPIWSQRLPFVATELAAAAATAGVLLLPTGARSVGTRTADGAVLWSRYSTETIALDARNGHQLWRATGDVAVLTDGSVLLVDHAEDGFGASRLRLVRLRDGATIWARDAGGAYTWATIGPDPGRPTGIATATSAGDIRVYRFADGAETAGRRVPWQPGSLTAGTLSQLYSERGLLYIVTGYAGSASATAYAPDTLRQLWQVTGDADGTPAACGAVLCLPTRNGLSGRDWATGAERWRTAGYDLGRPITGHLMLAGSDDAGRAILDDRTGHVLSDLGAGGAAWDAAAATVVALAPTRSPPGRLTVSRIDPRTGEAFLLGVTEPVVNTLWCQLEGLRLACETPRGRLVVTDVG
jgi:outer membrane protein assembly factor BamB